MDITSILKTVAPWIATAITGPFGGMAVEAAANALGLGDKTKEGLKAALQGVTPADMLALKKADQDFAVSMKSLGFANTRDLAKIAADDRNSARDMHKTVKSKVPAALSTLVTLGYFGILTGLLAGWLEVQDSESLLLMLGSLTTAWGMVMAFWFGTTNSSSDKTRMIASRGPTDEK